VQRAAIQIGSVLDLPSPGSFIDKDISTQPMGNTFVVFKSSFTQLNDELTNSTIPGLREIVIQISKYLPKFELFQKQTISELRRLFHQYETDLEQTVKWKRQMVNPNQFATSMFEFGERSHQICSKLCEGIRNSEQLTMQELKKAEDFQREIVNKEDGIVTRTTELIYAALRFAELPEMQKRGIATEISVWGMSAQISGSFLELKSFIGAPKLVPGDFAPKVWAERKEILPFYARVWSDCQGAGEVLAVKRKELVQVLDAPDSPYWLCMRASGERGYVHTAVLEPVDFLY
jgi:hypothetical protein